MTIVGAMLIYECDHPGCRRQMVASPKSKDTGWILTAGLDFCEEHIPPPHKRFPGWTRVSDPPPCDQGVI